MNANIDSEETVAGHGRTHLLRATEKVRFNLPQGRVTLAPFFAPTSVLVIGASERTGSVGHVLLKNLKQADYGGEIYVVNPKRKFVLDVPSYDSVDHLPSVPDLAIIVTPAKTVPEIVSDCARVGIPAGIIISAGFKECGEAGMELERQVQLRRGKMRIVGPNCLGIMSPYAGLNATFAYGMAKPGNVGFVSQSGALCSAVLDWSLKENVGFSAFVSLGSMADVNWADILQYLGEDQKTGSIMIYMETIGNARSFLSAAREVALSKPIILIKAGRSTEGAKATASHTGSLAGSDDVLEAAFRRAGVLQVDTIAELFSMAEALGKQPKPGGPRLAIITNGGGPAALATDRLISSGGRLAQLSATTVSQCDKLLPPHWSHGNPVDILGDANAQCYADVLQVVASDPGTDGVLVILTPQAMTECDETAERITKCSHLYGKPVLASWMGGVAVAHGEAILNRGGIPTFKYPDTAAAAFGAMWRYTANLRALYETPTSDSPTSDRAKSRALVDGILKDVLHSNRLLLSEVESKNILQAYGIPTVESLVAHNAEDAVAIANKLGYPIVLKLHSHTITHKAAVGGVRLNLADAQAVSKAFAEIQDAVTKGAGQGHFLGVCVQPMVSRSGSEIIIGSSVDAQFGPVILFGAGGGLTEVLRDRSLGLPPLNTNLAQRMIEKTQIYKVLKATSQKAGDAGLEHMRQLLVNFSRLVSSHPRIKEIDINPVLFSGDSLLALDARVILHDKELSDHDLPRLAIRPYPDEYVTSWRLRDGSVVIIRPVKPEDEPLMVRFHQNLSNRSVYLRYCTAFKLAKRIAHERMTRICFNDYDREIALVAEHTGHGGGREIIGVARLVRIPHSTSAEFALLIADSWQRLGLGTRFMELLIAVGKQEEVRNIIGYIMASNLPMRKLCHRAGFSLQFHPKSGEWIAIKDVKP